MTPQPSAPTAPNEPPHDRTDERAANLRGTGLAGILVTIVIALSGPVAEPLGAVLTWAWVRASRTPWSELGLLRPRKLGRMLVLATAGGVALKLAMKSLVMPLLGAPSANPAYQWLTGNAAALPSMIANVLIGAGITEELVFRGFLFLQLRKWLGKSVHARVAIVVLTSVYFGAWHFPVQGLAGAEQAVTVGLVLGGIYARYGRLWPLMVAHAAFDLAAVALIYGGHETRVAHWFFR